MDCTICAAKTKALISFAVTAKLICVFVFAYVKCWFSHDAAHFRKDLQMVLAVDKGVISLHIVDWATQGKQ